MITVHTLASGSEGNCLVIDAEGTRILVDAGISTRRIKTTLEQLGIALAQVDAILITHEHSDHISGLQTLVKHHRIPIYASPATACQLAWRIAARVRLSSRTFAGKTTPQPWRSSALGAH